MKKIVLALIVIVAAAVAGKSYFSGGGAFIGYGPKPMINPYPPSSPLYVQNQRFVDRFNAEPKLVERFAEVANSEGLYAELKRALNRGGRSLGSARIVGMLKAMSAVVPRLSPESCGKILLPRNDFDHALSADVRKALEILPPIQHQRFTDFYIDALLAEVNDAAIIPVGKEALDNAVYELGYRFHGDAERIQRVVSNPAAASTEDRCWGANTLTFAVSELAEPNAVAFARTMWGRAAD